MTTLGIDLGTGSVKVALVDDDGRVLATAREPYEVTSPNPGWAETDARTWMTTTTVAVHTVAEEVKEKRLPWPSAVGFSGQMHGLVPTDADAVPLGPAITWADTRSAMQAETLGRRLRTGELARLGSPTVPGFAATSLMWLRENRPDVFRRARWFLQPKDWLRSMLTTEFATERSDASGTLLYDVVADDWSDRALAVVGVVEDRLPEVYPSTWETPAHLTGFGGVPAVVGGADTACVIGGLGLREGDAFIAVGSGAQVVRVIGEPRPDPSLRTHLFATVGDRGDGWYRLGAVQSAGLVLGRVLDWLGATESDVEAALADDVRGDDPIFVPHLTGERTPFMDPTLTGSWHGLRLTTDRGAILRSVAEAIAHSVALAADAVREADAGAAWTGPVPLVGGGAAGAGFAQLLADTTGLALARLDDHDAAVVGAAVLATGVTSNPRSPRIAAVIEPDPDRADLLRERREKMVRYVRTEEAP